MPWTPAEAWAKLARGNDRFVAGEYWHPNQDAARRDSLTEGQTPFAVFFGCADSRVAAEIIFDRGLGDLFVVRTAGHVIDPGVLGSIEFGVAMLDIPLVVILGHDSCGAVSATVDAVRDGVLPGGTSATSSNASPPASWPRARPVCRHPTRSRRSMCGIRCAC